MLSFLPGQIKGIISFTLIVLQTIVVFIPFFSTAFLKLIIPLGVWRKICSSILMALATVWVSLNTFILWLVNDIEWDIKGIENLKQKDWYLVIANHQSWADILVLQAVFLRQIPFLKFFLKKELIWVPFMGIAWWALDFPFMKRYSKEFLKKNPHLKGKDIEITREACQKFKTIPVSVINFVEGTRFTVEKHDRQQSPFTHLLKPKAGGIAFVLGAMGEYLNSLINVTIVYPEGAQNFWAFLCGKVPKVKVNVEALPVTDEMIGDYFDDPDFRAGFQAWVNDLWVEKDAVIRDMLNGEQ